MSRTVHPGEGMRPAEHEGLGPRAQGLCVRLISEEADWQAREGARNNSL